MYIKKNMSKNASFTHQVKTKKKKNITCNDHTY